MSLAVDWAEQQDWFDAGNVELVGASLGVPFTAVAGALDERFTRGFQVIIRKGRAKHLKS